MPAKTKPENPKTPLSGSEMDINEQEKLQQKLDHIKLERQRKVSLFI